MCADESICARSIILSTLSYQTLVICTSFIVQQLIKTSSTRLDQLDFMRCLTISTSFFFFLLLSGKRIRSASAQPYRLSKIRSTCLYLSFYSCTEQCLKYAYVCVCVSLTTTIREEKRREANRFVALFLFHLSRLLLVHWVEMYDDARSIHFSSRRDHHQPYLSKKEGGSSDTCKCALNTSSAISNNHRWPQHGDINCRSFLRHSVKWVHCPSAVQWRRLFTFRIAPSWYPRSRTSFVLDRYIRLIRFLSTVDCCSFQHVYISKTALSLSRTNGRFLRFEHRSEVFSISSERKIDFSSHRQLVIPRRLKTIMSQSM